MADATDKNPVTDQEPQVPEGAEFDDAFTEAAAAQDKTPADTAAVEPAAPAGEPDDEAQPGPEEGSRSEGAASIQPPAPGIDDIWAKAPADLRAAHEAALAAEGHKLNSLRGRLSASDRKLKQFETGVAQPTSEPGGGSQRLKELMDTDRMKEAREQFPDLLDPLLEVLGPLAERIDGLQPVVAGVVQDKALAEESAQETALAGLVPDWIQVAQHPGFEEWLETQPRHVREAAQRNWDGIVDAEESADVFYRAKSALFQGDGGQQQPTRRDRQAAGARDVKINGPTAAGGEPDDYDAVFDLAAAKADRARGIGRT